MRSADSVGGIRFMHLHIFLHVSGFAETSRDPVAITIQTPGAARALRDYGIASNRVDVTHRQ